MSFPKNTIQHLLVKCLFKQPLTEKESKKLDKWCIRTRHYHARERWSDPRWVAREVDEMKHYPLDKVWEKITKRIKAEKK